MQQCRKPLEFIQDEDIRLQIARAGFDKHLPDAAAHTGRQMRAVFDRPDIFRRRFG